MKKFLFYTMTTTMVLSLLFSACKKKTIDDDDDDYEGNSNNTTTTSSITSIEATNITDLDGSINNVATVKLMVVTDLEPFTAYELASAQYVNKGFKINLPENVPSAYLINAANYYDRTFGRDIVVSDNQAKLLNDDVGLVAFNSAGKPIGWFYPESDDADIDYVYTDMNFTAIGKFTSGNYTYEVNSSFIKGWNIEYTTYLKSGYIYGTAKPSSSFNWYYEELDLDDPDENDNDAAVRFKKAKAYPITEAIVGNDNEVFAYANLGTSASTSPYYDIPSGNHNVYYYLEQDSNWYVAGSYNFNQGHKYTVVFDDNGANYTWRVEDDGQKSKSLMSAKCLKNRHKYVQMPKINISKLNIGAKAAVKISK